MQGQVEQGQKVLGWVQASARLGEHKLLWPTPRRPVWLLAGIPDETTLYWPFLPSSFRGYKVLIRNGYKPQRGSASSYSCSLFVTVGGTRIPKCKACYLALFITSSLSG